MGRAMKPGHIWLTADEENETSGEEVSAADMVGRLSCDARYYAPGELEVVLQPGALVQAMWHVVTEQVFDHAFCLDPALPITTDAGGWSAPFASTECKIALSGPSHKYQSACTIAGFDLAVDVDKDTDLCWSRIDLLHRTIFNRPRDFPFPLHVQFRPGFNLDVLENTTTAGDKLVPYRLPEGSFHLLGSWELMFAFILRVFITARDGCSDWTPWKKVARSIVTCIHYAGTSLERLKTQVQMGNDLMIFFKGCAQIAVTQAKQVVGVAKAL